MWCMAITVINTNYGTAVERVYLICGCKFSYHLINSYINNNKCCSSCECLASVPAAFFALEEHKRKHMADPKTSECQCSAVNIL